MIIIVTYCGLLSFLYIPSSELFLKLLLFKKKKT